MQIPHTPQGITALSWSASLTSDLGVSHYFCSLCLCGVYCLFLNTFSQMCHHLGWGVQLCPAVGSLEPDGISCFQQRDGPGLFSERPPKWVYLEGRHCKEDILVEQIIVVGSIIFSAFLWLTKNFLIERNQN